jgi:hypothetical protein
VKLGEIAKKSVIDVAQVCILSLQLKISFEETTRQALRNEGIPQRVSIFVFFIDYIRCICDSVRALLILIGTTEKVSSVQVAPVVAPRRIPGIPIVR